MWRTCAKGRRLVVVLLVSYPAAISASAALTVASERNGPSLDRSTPVLVGYATAGTTRVTSTAPNSANGEVAVLTRESDSNDISMDFGPRWNQRFSSSLLPATVQLVMRLTTSAPLPSEVPSVFLPLAEGRHASISVAGVDPAHGCISVSVSVDRLGADMLTMGLLTPNGLEGVAMFTASNRVLPIRASLLESSFVVASVSKSVDRCRSPLLTFRSEVEYPLLLRHVSFRTDRGIIRVSVNRILTPWHSIVLASPMKYSAVDARWIEADLVPFTSAPTELSASSAVPNVCQQWSCWARDWERRFRSSQNAAFAGEHTTSNPTIEMCGFRGFRFEEAAGALGISVGPDAFVNGVPTGWQRVSWAADGSECYGVVFRSTDGQIRVLLRLTRLALRYATQERLLLVAEDGVPLLWIPRVRFGYDLDYGLLADIPSEATRIRRVSEEAALLAVSEMARLGADRKIQPRAARTIETEQRRLVQYLYGRPQ